MHNVGDVLLSSGILSFVAGGPVPQEGGGLGQAWTTGSDGQSSDEAPACVEEERFCFVLVELYACHSLSDATKCVKFAFCGVGCQELTTYTEANSLQLVAYSVLQYGPQSFNRLMPELF